jgi:hypothetical protein
MDALHLAKLMKSLKLMGKINFPPFCRKVDEKRIQELGVK